jgi:hypothetical protein
MSQMDSVRRDGKICAICGISAICVRFWWTRDASPLYCEDPDSSTARVALRSE